MTNVDMSTDFSAIGDALQNIDLSGDVGAAIDNIDSMKETISSSRAELGATENVLSSTIKSLDNASFNQAIAQSRIEDTDMAKAVMEQVRYSLRRDTATIMQAQSQDLLSGIGKVVN